MPKATGNPATSELLSEAVSQYGRLDREDVRTLAGAVGGNAPNVSADLDRIADEMGPDGYLDY